MGLTRYLGWILLPILVWSLGGAWIEGLQQPANVHTCMLHDAEEPLLCMLLSLTQQLASSLPRRSLSRSRTFVTLLLLAGFTRSQFQRSSALNSEIPDISIPLRTIEPILPSPTIAADIFSKANSNVRRQYKNSLNSTHYMLYHAEAPVEDIREPFTFGFLTTMAKIEGKMRRKKPVTVTIIGGSVTAAYCKEPAIGCWVTPVTEWLLQENPQVHLLLVHKLYSADSVADNCILGRTVLHRQYLLLCQQK